MQNTNFLYDAINKQNDFRSVIINKSDEFFSHSALFPLLKIKDIEVKYIINEDSNLCYIFIKNQYGNIDVFVEEVNPNNIKDDISYIKSRIVDATEMNRDISLKSVFKKTYQKSRAEMKAELKSFIDVIKNNNNHADEKFIKSLEKDLIEIDTKEVDCNEIWPSPNLWLIQDYVHFLHNYIEIEKYSDEFYQSLGQDSNIFFEGKKEDFIRKKRTIKLFCEKMGYTKEHPFDFNDADNYVWIENDNLVIDDQNCTFLFNEDNNNLSIYFIDKEINGSIKSREDFDLKLKNNQLSLRNKVLTIKNGDVVYADGGSMMYVLSMTMDVALQSMYRYLKKIEK